MSQIGLGLITYNAPEKICQSAFTVPEQIIDHFVIVNDGTPYDDSAYPPQAHIIQHESNQGVAITKNDALRYLMKKNCEHIFIMEDDVIIKDSNVFHAYIDTANTSSLMHLNYALQGPANREQPDEIKYLPQPTWQKLVNRFSRKKKYPRVARVLQNESRAVFSETGAPAPRLIYDYPDGKSIALYQHCVGAFSYYHRSALEQTGLMDENFYNAWEHVEHTYQISKRGLTSPFWWFADITDSEKYLDNIENCMAQSSIASSSKWEENVARGQAYFLEKEGIGFMEIPTQDEHQVKAFLRRTFISKSAKTENNF